MNGLNSCVKTNFYSIVLHSSDICFAGNMVTGAVLVQLDEVLLGKVFGHANINLPFFVFIIFTWSTTSTDSLTNMFMPCAQL